jgi:hypothetical protein
VLILVDEAAEQLGAADAIAERDHWGRLADFHGLGRALLKVIGPS